MKRNVSPSSLKLALMCTIGTIGTICTAVSIIIWLRNGDLEGSLKSHLKTSGSLAGFSFAPPKIDKNLLSARIGTQIQQNQFPEQVELSLGAKKINAHIEYALNQNLQDKMHSLIGQYKPDYAAFVAIDAKSGGVISMVSYAREHREIENLALRASFPAASIFKVVTASAALDLDKAKPETVVAFNGSNHTLYRRNVQETRVTRWTRRMTLREAFARSANVFFGKLGLFHVGADSLMLYAERYLFNHPIPADIPVQTGYARFSSADPWSVVTAASGFTQDNTMSPFQGAMIAAAVANDGVMMEPFLVERLVKPGGELLYQVEARPASVVVQQQSAEELRELFSETVRSGTSRKAFRKTVRRGGFDDVEFGGKTGSLTGRDPFGKCDWFVGYARYRDRRVAVAALTVNEKKWRVKSSTLANDFFTQYIRDYRKSGSYAVHGAGPRRH